jgi:hypothetical protein
MFACPAAERVFVCHSPDARSSGHR